MPYLISQPVRVENAAYCFYDKFFSPEECDKVIELHKEISKVKAIVGAIDGKIDEKKRVSDVFWVSYKQEISWLFSKLNQAITEGNNRWFNFHLASLSEDLQVTKYKGSKKKPAHYDWHEDHAFTPLFYHRKLSGTLLLNDSFVGGEFEFLHTGAAKELTKGSLILFPSFRTHRVLPVTKGDRWSLVFWVSGPPWC